MADINGDIYVACLNCDQVNRVAFEKLQSEEAKCGKCKLPLPVHSSYADTSATGLQKIIKSCPKPVLVDFWAPWCGPCRAFAPVFENVSEQLKTKINFIKCNTEKYSFASQIFGIQGIPTMAIFFNGSEVSRTSGAMPPQAFVDWIHQSLS